MARQLTNVETFIIILFLVGIISIGIMRMGNETIANTNSNLDNDSVEYIANLNGVDNASLNSIVSSYRSSKTDKEKSISITDNQTQGNPKDQGLDFLFAKEKSFDIELTIKRVFNVPKFIVVDLLRFDLGDWEWVINIIGWLLTIIIAITIIYFIRGIVR